MKLNKYTVLGTVTAAFPKVDLELVTAAFNALVGRLACGEKGKETWSLTLDAATKKSGVKAKVTESRSGQSRMTPDLVAFSWAMRASEATAAGYGSLLPKDEVRAWFAKFEPQPQPTPPSAPQK